MAAGEASQQMLKPRFPPENAFRDGRFSASFCDGEASFERRFGQGRGLAF